jgi:phosphatidylglycerol:prolipoprotein diacylglycerol transferase
MYPILFIIPGIDLPIYSYGVMLGISLVLGYYIITALGKRDGLPMEKMTSCFIWTCVCAIAGARILYVLTNLSSFSDASFLDMVNMRKGGLVAYGGFIGGFLGGWVYASRNGIRIAEWGDLVAPSLGTGLGITRIGCLLYGCDYGKPISEDAPGILKSIGLTFPNWSTRFPQLTSEFEQQIGCMTGSFKGSPAFHHHVIMGLSKMGDAASALVYPTQLMEVANGWIAFAITMLVRRKTTFRGQTFCVFVMYYGLTRTFMEMIRGDTQRGNVGVLSTSQLVGIITFLLAMVMMYVLAKRAKQDPIAAMSLGSIENQVVKEETNLPPKKTKKRRK